MSDDLYRERAHLIALAAAYHPAVLCYSDPSAPDWPVIYFNTRLHGQMSWHVSPDDLDLFRHVLVVEKGDPRAQWDGHSTELKLTRLRVLAQQTNLASLVADLGVQAKQRRQAEGLSLRAAAGQIGIGFNTLTRLERGYDARLSNALAVLDWLTRPMIDVLITPATSATPKEIT